MTPEERAEKLKAARELAIRELWRRGELHYKFHATQQKIYAAIQASPRRKFFLLCSRRLGKTFMLLTLAFQTALQKPGSRVLFLAPVGKNAAEIGTDTARKVLEDCPAHLKPHYNGQTHEFTWKDRDSIVRLRGVNSEHADDLRGGAADLVIADECGQIDRLDYLLSQVILPMTMTTNGKILLATTPPTSPGHESTAIYEDLAASDCAVKFTILDAPHVDHETKREFLVEAGENPEHAELILRGEAQPKTTTARRELFCEFVTDANKAVLPEFIDAKPKIVTKWKRPSHFHAFTVLDPGWVDFSGILYAYYDFKNGKIVIEGEDLLRKAMTSQIAERILEREYQLWGDGVRIMRYSDVDKRLIADLNHQHALQFSQVNKPGNHEDVNLLRMAISSEELIIDPSCVHTIRQFENAVWDNRNNDFARQAGDGHYDLVAAAKYLVRSVNRRLNPYPPGYFDTTTFDTHITPKRRFWMRDRKLGLLADTPVGRKLSKKKRRTT